MHQVERHGGRRQARLDVEDHPPEAPEAALARVRTIQADIRAYRRWHRAAARPLQFEAGHRDCPGGVLTARPLSTRLTGRLFLSCNNASPLKIFLFPTFAAPDLRHENAWSLPISGVCLKSKTKRLKRKVLVNVLKRLTDVSVEEFESPLCQTRTAPFFMAPSRKKRIRFLVNGVPVATVKKTKRNGQFRARVLIKETDLVTGGPRPAQFSLSACQEESDITAADLNVGLIPARGMSVISDIDDTIKFSNVENRAELLANTFMREFVAIEGMADVYREQAARGAVFHYVTASPWQLYQPLHEFLAQEGYPRGSMHFRTFRISDQLVKRLGVIHRGGKAAAVRRILASFPERKFTLIGDSGEKDAEIYSRCYQQYPDRVEKVLIRLIRPEHWHRESVIESRLTLPPEVFQTFETAEQLRELMSGSPNIGN